MPSIVIIWIPAGICVEKHGQSNQTQSICLHWQRGFYCMQLGYLSIETNSEHKDLLRLAVSDRCPAIPEGVNDTPLKLRYIARFNDGEAALMHAHQLLRRQLVDVDAGLYRSDLATAVAAVESVGLAHGRIYLDPRIAEEVRSSIEARAEALKSQRRRWERFWYAVGYIALGFLLLKAVAVFF